MTLWVPSLLFNGMQHKGNISLEGSLSDVNAVGMVSHELENSWGPGPHPTMRSRPQADAEDAQEADFHAEHLITRRERLPLRTRGSRFAERNRER